MRRLARCVGALALFAGLTAGELKAQGPGGPPGARTRTIVDTIHGGVGGVTVDRLGQIYVADFGNNVWRVTLDGRVSLFATGLYGTSGNAIDSKGNLIQSSFTGNYISRIDRNGNAETLADEGLLGPVGVALDPADNAYVVNCSGNYVAHVTPGGEVTRFASSALFNCPNGITFGGDGNLYVVNFSDGLVLKVDPTGEVSEHATLPGGGNGHVAFVRGDLYATSFRGHRVYRVGLDGSVEPFAGTGAIGELDGPANEATFTFPNGISGTVLQDRLIVNDFLNRFPPGLETPPARVSSVRQIMLPSLSSALVAALRSGGIGAMTEAYEAWKASPSTGRTNTEIEVNQLGYQLMANGQLQAAIALFELNVESYPNAFNTHDSLGEAYMNAGRTAEAITSYRKSLELNPANTNAVAMLEKLKGG